MPKGKTMKKFEVTIRATITKTITIEAENKNEAIKLAHSEFDVNVDDNDENYKQDCLYTEEIGNFQ